MNYQKSIIRKITCLNNTVIENFFQTLKIETVNQEQYHNKRISEKLANINPVEFQNHAIHLNSV